MKYQGKGIISGFLLLIMICVLPAQAPGSSACVQADNFSFPAVLEGYRQSMTQYKKNFAASPSSFEAAWKCSRACWQYAREAHKQKVSGWQDICATYGKTGMDCAHKAIELAPEKPDGYYYYSLNVGEYADGVSFITAMREGLKDKVQTCLEKVYVLDRLYDNAEALLALGRFWAVVPWPFKDRNKALTFYREYQATKFFAANDEAHLYLAELLLEIHGDNYRAEAESLLKEAARSDDACVREQAAGFLAKINKSK